MSMLLGRILGPKKDEVTGECRKVHNEELYDLYCLPDIRVIRSRMRWAGNVARLGKRYMQGFGGIPEGMSPLGRPRRRWD